MIYIDHLLRSLSIMSYGITVPTPYTNSPVEDSPETWHHDTAPSASQIPKVELALSHTDIPKVRRRSLDEASVDTTKAVHGQLVIDHGHEKKASVESADRPMTMQSHDPKPDKEGFVSRVLRTLGIKRR